MPLPDTTDSHADDLVAELKSKANQLDAPSDNLSQLLAEIDNLLQDVHLVLTANQSIDRGMAVRSLTQIERRLDALTETNEDAVNRYRTGISTRLQNLSTAA